MKYLLILIIKAWQKCISPFYGNVCRFYPSCSEYALEMIKLNGTFKGCFYSFIRILKCNPFCDGGVDIPKKR